MDEPFSVSVMQSNQSQPLRLKPGEPIPGLRCDHQDGWLDVQLIMLNGETLSPLLPLGSDAAYVWVPKNGWSSLKRAWLQASGTITDVNELESTYVHGAVMPFTHWLRPDEFRAVAEYRNVIAIWRDPIDRYVSACRSHLNQLTTKSINARLTLHANGDQSLFARTRAAYDSMFKSFGIQSLDDNVDPRDLMNDVALCLPAWTRSFLEWTHHTLPQTSFLGKDPSLYTTVLGMHQIGELITQWQNASGQYIQPKAENVSKDYTNDLFRHLSRDDLRPEALEALERFYACDRNFLEQAQKQLGLLRI
ncbi:hypothetical protein [Prochlorococcus sp. MIT 0707]